MRRLEPAAVVQGRSARWAASMRRNAVNVCPRGLGRSSFRLYEVLQMGYIPVHVWDDCEWLPYKGTKADVRCLGWSVHVSVFGEWLGGLLAAPPAAAALRARRDRILAVRDSHFTTEGLKQQIAWLLAGSARSDLRCVACPAASNEKIASWFAARDARRGLL